jgi:Fic family protein
MSMWSTREAALAWGVRERWVRVLLAEGRVPGAVRQGRRWAIPEGSPKPADGRAYRYLDVDPELQERLAAVDALRDEVGRRRPLTQGELERLRREFVVEYTYDSNAIEGSTLTLKETALILDGVTIGDKPVKEHLEAIGHADAFGYVEELVSSGETLTSRVIRDIHFLVLADRPQDRGRFRRAAVRILGSSRRPPEPILVPELIDELVAEHARDRRHPLERAARFHLRFEAIHPFIDGNGRTGRLLLNLMLMRHGYLPVTIKYTDRRRYYDCFEAHAERDDTAPMTDLVAEYARARLAEWLAIVDGTV